MYNIVGGYGAGELPLTGAILCCTSIAPEQRTQLAVVGAQMGATIKLDLTSDVTHLIVGSSESAKYRYVAKSRDDVKVLSPAWLEALREVWIEGDDNVDLAALEAEHRLPTFHGLKICLTGFDNPEQRRYIQETVDKNGAEYHGDLTKAVTHLIAATPTGKKYEHAQSWRMKIVTLEWFEQSLERGMVLEEAFYNPTLPVEQRGRGAWDRKDYPPPSIGKRARASDQNEVVNLLRRKLRRSASTKLGSQSEALWAGITAANTEIPHNEDDDWTDSNIDRQHLSRDQTPTADAQDAASLSDDAPLADPAADLHQPQDLPPAVVSQDGIFAGSVISTHGFEQEKTSILRMHLENNGARFAQPIDLNKFQLDDLRHGFLVVPFDCGIDLTSLPDRAGAMNLVTNLWVERCLHGKRLIDPADDILCKPFGHLSISGFSELTINSTGFVGIELLHVTKIVKLMGAAYDEQLSTKTSVVICSSGRPNEQKLNFATERSIPALHATWLWECIRSGKTQPFDGHQLNKLPPARPQKLQAASKPQPPTEVATAKLSTKESFEMQQKKKAMKTISKVRGPKHTRALDLAISVDPTPEPTTNSITHSNTDHSTNEQDESFLTGLDGPASLPLQDTDANSPRRPSSESLYSKPTSRARSSSAESLIRPPPRKSRTAKEPTPDSINPANSVTVEEDTELAALPQKELPEEKDYSDILAQLRANRKPLPSPAEQGTTTRRRGRRQLGRATSTRSNQSTADSSTGTLNLDDDPDREKEEVYQPSQELGWDSPGAAKAREQMIKRLGGRVTETSVRVEGIGVVRDVPSELGQTSRPARRRREKGF